MDFGFTNDAAKIEAARHFRDAAVADGWSIRPTYGNHEPVESAASLNRDGFHMSILTREKNTKPTRWKYEVTVHIWGPDGLAIKPPSHYDFAEIQAHVRHCNYCDARDVDTQRVGFAGRCCAACLREARKKIQTPGWTN